MVKTEQSFSVDTEFTTHKYVNISANMSNRTTINRKPDLTYDLETIFERLTAN